MNILKQMKKGVCKLNFTFNYLNEINYNELLKLVDFKPINIKNFPIYKKIIILGGEVCIQKEDTTKIYCLIKDFSQ